VVKPGSAQLSRNAGPSWGFQFLVRAERSLPAWIFRLALMVGTWVALAFMPVQRRYSQAYLQEALSRRPRLTDVWRHFFALVELIMLRLHIAGGAEAKCALDPRSSSDFETLIASGEPALFGTFHFGHSDLIGFLLGARGRRVSMIRLQMENSEDTRLLKQQFGRWISFIWVNDRRNLLFAIKSAIEAGESLAMQCDRVEFSAKTGDFRFLGAVRRFPITIYHLSILFVRPVMVCLGVPDGEGGTRVLASPLFKADPAASRDENMRHAHRHFQGVLTELETLIRQYPMLWFNFLPLNPEVPPPGGSR